MTLPKFGYALWESAESWSEAEGDTFEAAASFALAENPSADEVWICEAKPVDASVALLDALQADDIIERAEECRENRPEDCAGWYEDKLFDDSQKAQLRLGEWLRVAARAWLAEFPGATAHIWESHNPQCVRREDATQ